MLPTGVGLLEKVPKFFRRHKLMRASMWFTGEDPLQLVRIRGDAFGYADMSDGFLRLIVIEGKFAEDFFRLGARYWLKGCLFLRPSQSWSFEFGFGLEA